MTTCFPLLDGLFQNLLRQENKDKLTQHSAFVYCNSWDDDEEMIAYSSVSSSDNSQTSASARNKSRPQSPERSSNPQAPPLKSFSIRESIAKTYFPQFEELENLDFLSDDEYDTDDEDLEDLEKKYSTKEDEDVAVFLKIIEHMPLKSLLHLLQGHVRAQNLCIEQYPEHQQDQHHKDSNHRDSKKLLLQKPQKKFRWAEVTDNQVRIVVHYVEERKEEYQELWWSPDDFTDIKTELIDTIKFFRRHHTEHIDTLESIVTAREPESVLEDHMKKVTKHSYARGLEGHMCNSVRSLRKKHVRRVLNAQVSCKCQDKSYEESSEVLREQSIENSRSLAEFARRMGRCDEIEALTASISRWN